MTIDPRRYQPTLPDETSHMPRPLRSMLAVLFVWGVSNSCPTSISISVSAEPEVFPFSVPAGMKVELFAQEPMLGNPVAFCLDELGRVYVAEEYRFNRGTEENRTRPFFLEDDLQIRSLDDRLAMYRKYADRFEGGMSWFSKYSDQVRRLEDRDGDGKADVSTVFAGGFNGVLDGLAAGVIARDGDVYFTCIPNLWRLRDADGDGKAEVREVVHRGFGVNAAFLGHDLHGLVWGPDGKLYFSVGDRGFHVETREKTVLNGPRSGAVFRCDPDGSRLEVVHRGLRNPQELAFDAYGNLFAVDNNCDKGDDARLVYVIEGADSGWNMSYQSIPEPYLTGPWHAENMWHLARPDQPAWIVPPVGKLGAGPSGFTAYPGLGLGDRYADHFFYCNFSAIGEIVAFAVEPKGAGFSIADLHDFIKPVKATDVDFGYDGKMYFSEFGKLEWDGSNNSGRVFAAFDNTRRADPRVRETEALFRVGFKSLSDQKLAELLKHPDMRARLRAQFALAERGERSIAHFKRAIEPSEPILGRLHGLWGLGQLGRDHPEASAEVEKHLADADSRVRGQAAKTLGEIGYARAGDELWKRLKDGDPRVRLLSAIALGKLAHRPALEALVQMIRDNADRDPYLRHAGAFALAAVGRPEDLRRLEQHPDQAVRLAVVLCYRRQANQRVARFLQDESEAIVAEAARAVNDLPIEEGTASLAGLLHGVGSARALDEPTLRRSINAAFRSGTAGDAEALARFATDARRSDALRDEALAALSDWSNPSPRDRVTGFWRPTGARNDAVLNAELGRSGRALLESTEGRRRARVIDLLANRDVNTHADLLLSYVENAREHPSSRLAALKSLARRKEHAAFESGLRAARASDVPELRLESRRILAGLDPTRAAGLFADVLLDAKSSVPERQDALVSLGALNRPEADRVLADRLDKVKRDEEPSEVELELFEAAATRKLPELARARERLASPDPLSRFRSSLRGGDAERGRSIFVNNATAQCSRCHRVDGKEGGAGPELSKVGSKNPREYLLQSLLDPDFKIAAGFATIQLALTDGRVVSGVLQSENVEGVVITRSDGRVVKVPASEIEERSPPKSAMPKVVDVLTPRELRDVVEYLSSLR